MKILIFCPYYPPHIGGLESHADEFNKYLSQKGADIIVFTPRLPKNAPEKEIKHNNVEVIRFPAFEIIPGYPLPRFWNFRFWKSFFDLFKKNPDIVISRTRFFATSIMALKYAKLKRKKWIHIEHGSDFVQLSSKIKTFIAKAYDYTFGFLIFRFSDLNISVSQTVKKFIYKFDRRDSPVIYRGLDAKEIDKIKPDYKLKEKCKDKIILAWTGRLYKWKGVENGILAIKSLPKESKEKIIFLIMGDGEDCKRLLKLSENENSIQMTGPLPREKIISILKISDIYVHSSFPGGGLSTSLLEAMYCRCAIIAAPNEGASEVIADKKNGLLITSPFCKKIAAALLSLIENQGLRKNMAQNASRLIAEKFDWQKSIEAYEKIFQTLAKK